MAKSNRDLATKMRGGSAQKNTVGAWLGTMSGKLEQKRDQLSAVLPANYSVDRFIGTVTNYMRLNRELWGCNPVKLMDCFLRAAQQNLDFGVPNEAHIIAFNKSNPVLYRGYKGYLKIARRSPKIGFIDANVVYENDVCEVELGSAPTVKHQPKFGSDRGAVVGFYAIAKDKDGNDNIWLMDNDQVLSHAKKFTKATKSGPFAGVTDKGPDAENWEAYGLKTCIIALVTKKLDMGGDLADGLADEMAAERGIAPAEFDLDEPENSEASIEEPIEVEATVTEAEEQEVIL